MKTKLLTDLKSGDEIAVKHWTSRMHSVPRTPFYEILKIERVTKTQLICGNRRFRKKDGYEIGTDSSGIWESTEKYAEVMVDRVIKTNQKYNALLKQVHLKRFIVNAIEKNNLSTAVLEEIVEWIKREVADEN
jgi:hypothetical protein